MNYEENALVILALETSTVKVKSLNSIIDIRILLNAVIYRSYYQEYILDINSEIAYDHSIKLDKGDKLILKAELPSFRDLKVSFKITGLVKLFGNIKSLITSEDYYFPKLFASCDIVNTPEFPDTVVEGGYESTFNGCNYLISVSKLPAVNLKDHCYCDMFSNCLSLEFPPDLLSTELATGCYDSMFYNCSSLRTVPILPATKLKKSCYRMMFSGCSNLTEVSTLVATDLADNCYSGMFTCCKGLISVPTDMLPAVILKPGCYSNMFEGCTNLLTPPNLDATILSEYCYLDMFGDCYRLQTPPKLPATTLAVGCYQGMFKRSGILFPPKLPAYTLCPKCYQEMFIACKGLKEIPELNAVNLASSCYESMFEDCIQLKYAHLEIPDPMECSCKQMFAYCENLLEVTLCIKDQVPLFGAFTKMFYNCNSLEDILLNSKYNLDSCNADRMFYLNGVRETNLDLVTWIDIDVQSCLSSNIKIRDLSYE